MGFFLRRKKEEEQSFQSMGHFVVQPDSTTPLEYLVRLVKQLRPKNGTNYQEAEQKLGLLLAELKNNKAAPLQLQAALQAQFRKRSFVPALTDSGLQRSRGFLQELVTKMKHRILPPLLEPQDFLYLVHQVFYKRKDWVWVQKADRRLWVRFFDLLGAEMKIGNESIQQELNEALHILTQRTVTLGLEKEILGSYFQLDYHEYPYFLLDRAVQQYLLLYDEGRRGAEMTAAVANITEAISTCRQIIDAISSKRKERGTSLAQTYVLIRLEQHLERLQLITDILNCEDCYNAERFADFFVTLVYYEKTRYSIRAFLSRNVAFLTYKITEHGGKRGKKYITTTREEFWTMIRSSMGGGFIVAFTALVKSLISRVPLPPFWLGFTYSVNYAASFQLMHETGATLATKQPAFTASSIASSVDYFRAYEQHGLNIIAIIIARTCRTQLAAFFGNLVVVFPLSYGLAALYHAATGHPLLSQKEALQTLEGQHPLLSLSLLYACFTGVALFLSGLIAGSVENSINYGNIGERIRKNPGFRNVFSANKLNKFSSYVENNLGALMGNIALGFFLGMAGFFGKIFGLPFDIRHITISSGNAAMAYYTTGNTPGYAFLLTVLGGILLIGLLNFLFSFALAFFVALRSRGVRLRDYPQLTAVVGKYFIRYPFDFIFPPRSEMNRRLESA